MDYLVFNEEFEKNYPYGAVVNHFLTAVDPSVMLMGVGKLLVIYSTI